VASSELLSAVESTLNADDVRPLTDHLTVRPAEILTYQVEASLVLYTGPDAAVVQAAASASVTDYVQRHHLLGNDITLSGLYAALHKEGVQRVNLVSPDTDIVVASYQAAWCSGISITDGGRDE
jgi:phage-related baseplate assembly protein